VELSRKAEIADLENTVLGQQHVFWLEISVHNVMRMHKITRLQHLPYNFLRFQVFDAIKILALNFIKNGAIELLKDQENAVVFSEDF